MNATTQPQTLSALLDAYAVENPLSAKAEENYRRSIRRLGEHLGREATTADLTPETVSAWLSALESSTLAQRTIFGHRANVLIVWRFAAGLGLADRPSRVRKVKKPKPNPVSWTPDEWKRVIAAADGMTGVVLGSGVPRRDYFGTLFRVAYDTGLRRSDLFALTQEHVRGDGRVRVVQHKTQDAHQPIMRPDTLVRFRRLPGEYPLNWPDQIAGLYYWFRKLRKVANVSQGCLHQTRRTGATMVVRHTQSYEEARKYLGHETSDMWKYYVDMGVADVKPVLPPDMEDLR